VKRYKLLNIQVTLIYHTSERSIVVTPNKKYYIKFKQFCFKIYFYIKHCVFVNSSVIHSIIQNVSGGNLFFLSFAFTTQTARERGALLHKADGELVEWKVRSMRPTKVVTKPRRLARWQFGVGVVVQSFFFSGQGRPHSLSVDLSPSTMRNQEDSSSLNTNFYPENWYSTNCIVFSVNSPREYMTQNY
jgi:hypothetical protein